MVNVRAFPSCLGGERLEDKIFFATPHPEVGECQSTTNGIDRIALQVGL